MQRLRISEKGDGAESPLPFTPPHTRDLRFFPRIGGILPSNHECVVDIQTVEHRVVVEITKQLGWCMEVAPT